MNTLILVTDLLEKVLLLILMGLSIWSISIVLDRRKNFKKEFSIDSFLKIQTALEQKPSKSEFIQSLNPSLFLGRVLKRALIQSTDSMSFEKALSAIIKSERLQLEKGFSVLATLGANAPFIGLFGTVLGIIRAFSYLGTQTGSSAVMSGVSQALYATAMGLLVAIPAVIANNYFAHQLRSALQQCESLRDEVVARKIV